MNGIEAKPINVGLHLRGTPRTLASFNSFPEPQVIRLIMKPGIATEANICHMNTSPACWAAFVDPPPSALGFCVHVGGKLYR